MGDGANTPVVAGLAAGIAFVLLFATFSSMIPAYPSEDQKLINNTKNLKEVKVFWSEYPGGKVEVDRSGSTIGEEGDVVVRYSHMQINYANRSFGEINLMILMDKENSMPSKVYVNCSAGNLDTVGSRGVIPIDGNITRFLQTAGCAK